MSCGAACLLQNRSIRNLLCGVQRTSSMEWLVSSTLLFSALRPAWLHVLCLWDGLSHAIWGYVRSNA